MKNASNSKKRLFAGGGICSVILVLLPILCVLFISVCFGYKGSLDILIPVWSDEFDLYNQVDSIINYGRPLGYYGYNESYAQIGTFGPWGIAPLLPYALFGKIFGWQLNTMTIANICFLSLALLIFIIMTKPTNKQIRYLIIAYLALYITIGYSLTSMSEGLRYACAIILTGFIIWLDRCTCIQNDIIAFRDKVFIGIGAVFTLYCIQVFLPFILIVFIFSLFLLRRVQIKSIFKVFIACTITIFIAIISNKTVGMVSCPYFQLSTIQLISERIKADGLYLGICFLLSNFFNNMSTINLALLVNIKDLFNGILVWYFVSYVGLMFFCVKTLLCDYKRILVNNEFRDLYFWLSLYFLFGFLIGYCLLYTGTPWTLCRGINTGLIMALFLLIFSTKRHFVKYFALVALFAIVSIFPYYGILINERNAAAQNKDQILNEQSNLSEIIKIDPTNNYWDNTVALYGDINIFFLTMPSGFGENYMISGNICEKSKYAVLPISYLEHYKQNFENAGYSLIYTDEIFSVFERGYDL